MNSIATATHEVHFNEIAIAALQTHLAKKDYSKIFILVDENTEKYCLEAFKKMIGADFDVVLEIPTGEENKNISTCSKLWQNLSDLDGDRKSLLINLGGGVLTDLGGFVASTFKRGIDFINIPTTLLSMVDASIGGKTGVDLGSLKNQIGVINQPNMVLIFPEFLHTLNSRQIKSGFAEMLKHGLISSEVYWNDLKDLETYGGLEHIKQSVAIKNEVVLEDPNEMGIRKKLNFGHTLGHAIESYFLQHETYDTLLHGEAIAIGMVLEAYLSHELVGLSKIELDEIKTVFGKHFEPVSFSASDIRAIIDLLKFDKKNSHGQINFVLLYQIGQTVLDIKVSNEMFDKAFAYYMEH